MKKILLIVLLIGIMKITLSAIEYDLFSKDIRQSGYISEFDFFNNFSMGSRSTQLRSDGSLVVFTEWTLYEAINLHGFGVFIYDVNGDLIWHELESIITSNPVNVTVVDIDENDNINFLTTIMSGLSTIHYWRLNSQGSFSLLNIIEDVPHSALYFSQALRIANNEILAVGKTTNITNLYSSACLYRFSSTGDTLKTVIYPHDQVPLNSCNTFYQIIPKSDNLFYVTCEFIPNLSSILEVDVNGIIQNRINIDNPNSYSPDTSAPTICLNESNGEFLISYNKLLSDPPPYISQFEIAKINQDSIEVLFNIDPNILKDIRQMYYFDNHIFIYGILTSTIHGILQKYSLNGDLIWQREQTGDNNANGLIGYYGTFSPELIKIGYDGCIYWSWADYHKLYAIKLLSNGQLANEQEIIPVNDNYISVYPNPGKDKFNIIVKSDKLSDKTQQINIYNIKGQKVRSLNLMSDKNENMVTYWDGKDQNNLDCPSGIYFIKSSHHPNLIKKFTMIR